MSERLAEQLALLPNYLSHHIALTLTALAIGIIICLPLAALVTRVKALQWPVMTIASILQTIPGIAMLALMVPLLGQIGALPALIALVLYSMLPMIRNTVTGILDIDSSLTEAARGSGMTSMQILRLVELPLAAPVIIAGIRTSAVWIVGTATLATPVGATSLGNYIFSGLQTQNYTAVIVGSASAAALAIILDQFIHLIEYAASQRKKTLAIGTSVGLLLLALLGMSPLYERYNSNTGAERIVIGAKTFTEQYVLSEMMSEILTDAGFEIEVRSGMGSTILFEALTNNEVDCYVDYSGTIWANYMQRKSVPKGDTVLVELTKWLMDQHQVLCLGALGFENTYALAIPREFAENNKIVSVSDLSSYSRNMKMGSDYEFFGRPEWVSLRDTYRLNFTDLVSMDHSLMYAAINEDAVNVIAAYSTDGSIAAFDLVTLTDPQQALPPYDATLLLSPRASSNQRLIEALNVIIGKITAEEMRSANKAVDLDNRSVSESAKQLRRAIFSQ